jgi:hypothetical protein
MRALMMPPCGCVAPMGQDVGPSFPHGKYCRTRVLNDAYTAITELRRRAEITINITGPGA